MLLQLFIGKIDTKLLKAGKKITSNTQYSLEINNSASCKMYLLVLKLSNP